MQYTTLGQTGLVVSRLAYGAMTFTTSQANAIYKTGTAAAAALVGRALDAGINFFDTADGYAKGESEQMLGAALKSKRQDVVIATKVGFRSGEPLTQAGLTRRHILWSVDQSLKRLGTDWIDVYICHKEDPHTPIEETVEALDAIVRAGKARYLGFSNWSAWKVAAALEIQKAKGLAPFTHGQMYYSLVGRDVERDIVPMMQRYGIGMTVWSPLAGGFLSGKYTPDNLKDSANRMSGWDFLPFDKAKGFELVEQMRVIANAHGATVAQVALAWLLAKASVTSVLVGASKLHQLEDNLGALQVKLTPSEMMALDEAMKPEPVYPNWFIDNMADQATADAIRRA